MDTDRRKQLLAETASAFVFAALAMTILIGAEHVSRPAGFDAYFQPWGILRLGSTVVLLSSVVWLARSIRALAKHEHDRGGRELDGRAWLEALLVVAVLVVGWNLTAPLGLIGGATVTYLLLLVVYRERSWWYAAVTAVAFAVAVFVIFDRFLAVPMPRSPYVPWL